MQMQRVIGCTYKPAYNPFARFAATNSHAKASHASTNSSTQQRQLPIHQHSFQTLRTYTPVCLADIAQPQRDYTALIAASDVQKGQIVLQLPACNSLCVPISESVYRWECSWLDPFEAVHGPLPGALSYYLADQDIPPVLRLAALILYLKRTNSTRAIPSSTSSSDFWSSWFDLLPLLSAATYPGAGWTDSDIQQLHFEPAMAVFAAEAEAYKSLIGQMVQDLNGTDRGLQTLGLAPDTGAASWAVFIAKTRSGSDTTSMWLHPIHDFINHSDTPNCQAAPSCQGYLVKAVMDIPAGCEITISYAPPEGLCNLELLISWGFTTTTKPLDWAIPQTYHLLPPVDYNITLAAAVELALQQQQQQQVGHLGHSPVGDSHLGDPPEVLSWEWCDRLGVAAASLPLGSGSSSSSSSGSSSTAAQYANAARVLQAHGGVMLQQQHEQDSQQQRWGRDPDPLQAYLHPDPHQAFTNHQTFLCTFENEFHRASNEVEESTGCNKQGDHWFQRSNAECLQLLQGVDTASLQLQQLSAAAVHNASQLLLLQSRSTIQQDEKLLKLLHHQQQLSNSVPATSGTGIQSHNGSSSSASSSSRTTGRVDSRLTQLLAQFDQLQQQLYRNLVLLQASDCASATSSSDSSSRPTTHRLTAAQNIRAAAARRVISTVLQDRTGSHQKVPGNSAELLLQQASEIVVQQGDLLTQLQELQQHKQQHQPALILDDAARRVEGWMDSHTVRSFQDSVAFRARMLAAVRARLGHKRLLQLCAQLADEVRLLVQTLLESRSLTP